MPNYAPTVNPGDTRRRIPRITGNNILHVTPSMDFVEEEVVLAATEGGNPPKERSLGVTRRLRLDYDPARVLVTHNPITDQPGPVGRIPADLTMAEAYAVLYTLGRTAQVDADAAEAAAAAASATEGY